MNLGQKLKSIRTDNNLTMEELKNLLNRKYDLNISKSMISRWENEKSEPLNTYLSAYAKEFDLDLNELLGINISLDKIPRIKMIKKFVNVPILGEIACGQPMFCEENFEGIFQIDEDLDQPDFCLIARGDSMIDAGIHDGDIAFMRKTPIVENGKIAAVYYDEDVTLKRYYSKGNQVILQPENKFYSPIIIDLYEDIPLLILGELIGVYSKVSR